LSGNTSFVLHSYFAVVSHHRCGLEATNVASLFSLDDVSSSSSFNAGTTTKKKVTLLPDKTPPTITLLPGQYETSEFVTPLGASGLITTAIVGMKYIDPGERDQSYLVALNINQVWVILHYEKVWIFLTSFGPKAQN
jgi:hypothetical protein